MKRFKRVLCFVLPLVLVVAIAFGVILPVSLAAPDGKQEELAQKFTTAYDGQVVYAADGSGASSAARDYKGGAIFLEPDSNFIMSGGTISGHQNTYGGAVYVSSGATFTMKGGTISHNRAEYGGAVYVEAGGRVVVDGGTITGNWATAAPAIYVEEGGSFEFLSGKIEDNTYDAYRLEKHEIGVPTAVILEILKAAYPQYASAEFVSSTYDTMSLYSMQLGSWPQSYVGDELNETLKAWYSASSPSQENTYEIRTITWQAYKYTDGNIYARGNSYPRPRIARDPAKPDGEEVWFKVEPISWVILNYKQWQAGEENVQLMSEKVLTGDVPYNVDLKDDLQWSNSSLRSWLNDQFYNAAFTQAEAQQIVLKELENNCDDNLDNERKGETTKDNVWLLSLWEAVEEGGYFRNEIIASIGGREGTIALDNALYLSYTDFSLCNYLDVQMAGQIPVVTFWSRSDAPAMGGSTEVMYFPCLGRPYYDEGDGCTNNANGVCPCIELNIKAGVQGA